MITLDGAQGEGGGQILRTALSLAALTGQPFTIKNIRAGRSRPGLLRQHLTAVNAAAEISGATLTGATLGSKELTFKPGRVRAGDFAFAVGTAGSATLVLQTVLPPLLTAPEPTTLKLGGGTHNPAAPPFEFLNHAFLPLLRRMGVGVEAKLLRPGFFPAGGGEFTLTITPCAKLEPLHLLHRGALKSVVAVARVAALPASVAQRELDVIAEQLKLEKHFCRVDELTTSLGPGNVAQIVVEYEHVSEVFTGFGERGVSAEAVAGQAVKEARAYFGADPKTEGPPVGEHLADQLLLPLALARGGAFRTLKPSLHTCTNIETIGRFLDVKFSVGQCGETSWEVVPHSS